MILYYMFEEIIILYKIITSIKKEKYLFLIQYPMISCYIFYEIIILYKVITSIKKE